MGSLTPRRVVVPRSRGMALLVTLALGALGAVHLTSSSTFDARQRLHNSLGAAAQDEALDRAATSWERLVVGKMVSGAGRVAVKKLLPHASGTVNATESALAPPLPAKVSLRARESAHHQHATSAADAHVHVLWRMPPGVVVGTAPRRYCHRTTTATAIAPSAPRHRHRHRHLRPARAADPSPPKAARAGFRQEGSACRPSPAGRNRWIALPYGPV